MNEYGLEKVCDLKINDMESVKALTHALLLNGYKVYSFSENKKTKEGLCFTVRIFDLPYNREETDKIT
ncbi:MAG: hypothetical protein J6D42_11495 [Clostridia bacterium]|nr:hypothetical protein [Clostridia bacterium]